MGRIQREGIKFYIYLAFSRYESATDFIQCFNILLHRHKFK